MKIRELVVIIGLADLSRMMLWMYMPAAATATSQASDTELTNNNHHQFHCPDIVISCSPDSDDDDDNIDDVTGVEQVSCAFDQLLHQQGDNAATLDDVIGDVTRLRDVIEGDSGRVVNRELLAAECRQLVVDCKQLVSSVFYCSTSDMTLNANRALHSLSALVRHSQNVSCDVRAPAQQQLVSNVRRVVTAFEATITAAKNAVGSPTAGVLELAYFIKQASTLARCLQLLLSNVVDVKS